MGNFKIEISAVGGHMVDRDKKHLENVDFNESGEDTPDAIAKRCVDDLIATGCSDVSAIITHWPGTETQVVDDLVTGVRKKKEAETTQG